MTKNNRISRRGFLSGASTLATATVAGGLVPSPLIAGNGILPAGAAGPAVSAKGAAAPDFISPSAALDLSPAQWIWYPAKRILPNSFFHFRKTFRARQPVKSATGWIVGDSRYVLFCNGKRVQFGPAPADPRFTEADPVDLTALLAQGDNAIGATVLYYGFGDGTWPAGKAGFIFRLDVAYEDGTREQLVSDPSWQVQLARSWQPGMYKRWYLRSLQESFDNRHYPHGWHAAGFQPDATWKPAVSTGGSADKTALNTAISDYLYDSGSPSVSQLRRRLIPLVKEHKVSTRGLTESHWLHWQVPPQEYFDLLTADAYRPGTGPAVQQRDDVAWTAALQGDDKGLVMTFELPEQVVGWPYFSVEAPAGTTIELLVQQGHVPYGQGGPPLTNTNLNSWTRFICREGRNDFMTFDYESVKWIQLHLHGGQGGVVVYRPGVLRRVYDFPAAPVLTTSDAALQKLAGASFNTILNNSQDTIVDCMGRERQQYSGDIGHVVHVLHRAYGEQALPARFVNTFSQGITLDGFFMDSWPAYDRLNRLAQRQLGLTPWGPLLDHSIGFNYDAWYHYLYTGRKGDLEEVFPRLTRFFGYLQSLARPGELLPVENLGVPTVWMDTDSYKAQRHKQCAFNLYAAGMLQDAFANLCAAFGRADLQSQALEVSRQLVKAVRRHFWSASEGMLINNLPWYKEEGEMRTCERSIAQYLLSGFAAGSEKPNLVRELVQLPARFGVCYPANAHWRYWALAACGQIQPVLDEFRTKWITLAAVQQNNAMPESWNSVPDEHAQYSHASIAPLYVAYMSIAGVSVLEPGAHRISIRPQPGDLEAFSLVNHTAQGPVHVGWTGKKGKRTMRIRVPDGVAAQLWVDEREKVKLAPVPAAPQQGCKGYLLKGGKAWTETLRFT